MLYKVNIKDSNQNITRLIHIENEDELKVLPNSYKIVGRIFYKISLKYNEVISIIKFPNKTVIYPSQINCHPKTKLEDIIIINKENKTPPPITPSQWKFKSSSSDSIYIVTETLGKLKCNCPGFYRAKGNCKHVKEVKGL